VPVRQVALVGFREHLGDPRGVSVRRMRLEIAGRLIATTELPLSKVARRCGFSSTETLRQAFTTAFGISSRTFRETHARTLTDRTEAGLVPPASAANLVRPKEVQRQ
jgi:transcriptional regulator GlxA family with amidase domain